MKPDMEDYSELESGRRFSNPRSTSWLVLALAIGGFIALAFYAYHSGDQPVGESDETLVVDADPNPIKQAPEVLDGEQFANKEKTIYDAIAPSGENRTVENLLPEPEKPIDATSMEDTSAQQAPVAPAEGAGKPAVSEIPAPMHSTAPAIVNEKKITIQTDGTLKTESNEASVGVIDVPEAEVKTTPTPVVKPAPKPTAKPKAAPTATGGSYKIQLGAFKSEAEAHSAWKKISTKHGLKGNPSIVKAELPNGTFYRLRAGGYGSMNDAKAACASLSGQACFAVK